MRRGLATSDDAISVATAAPEAARCTRQSRSSSASESHPDPAFDALKAEAPVPVPPLESANTSTRLNSNGGCTPVSPPLRSCDMPAPLPAPGCERSPAVGAVVRASLAPWEGGNAGPSQLRSVAGAITWPLSAAVAPAPPPADGAAVTARRRACRARNFCRSSARRAADECCPWLADPRSVEARGGAGAAG